MRLRALGQVEVPAALVNALIAMAASAVTWFVSATWAEARAAAEFRATMADHTAQIDRLRVLPVEALMAVPAKVELMAAAAESQARSVAEIKQLFQVHVRPVSGKR